MAWHRMGDKTLSEPMLTQFTDTYTTLGADELNVEFSEAKTLSEPMLTQFTDTYTTLGADELNKRWIQWSYTQGNWCVDTVWDDLYFV